MRTNIQILNKGIFLFLLTVFIVGLHLDTVAQEAQSDYQIQQDFREKYKAISENLEFVESSEEVKRLMKELNTLEKKYQDHNELLNKVLYPETFKGQFISLKRRIGTLQRRMATIEYQEEKLVRLNDQLAFYDNHLDLINTRTDSIREAMRQSVRSEKELSDLVRRYRENLEKRDELILSFVDSVMITYNQMDLESVQDLENARQQSRLEANGNALHLVENIARENIEFLEANPRLSTEEYLRMNAVQQQFEKMWGKMGERLTSIYVEIKPGEAKKEIDNVIKKWDETVTERMWTSLNRAVEEENIDLAEFTNRQEFFNGLNGYLNNSISSSKEKATEEGYQKYQKFNSFWTNQVKVKWSDYLNQGDILSNRQIASVDQKLDEWAISAEPEPNSFLVYLLGASVLAIVVLGVMLAREKNHNRAS